HRGDRARGGRAGSALPEQRVDPVRVPLLERLRSLRDRARRDGRPAPHRAVLAPCGGVARGQRVRRCDVPARGVCAVLFHRRDAAGTAPAGLTLTGVAPCLRLLSRAKDATPPPASTHASRPEPATVSLA